MVFTERIQIYICRVFFYQMKEKKILKKNFSQKDCTNSFFIKTFFGNLLQLFLVYFVWDWLDGVPVTAI
jgi:hypothetical protein